MWEVGISILFIGIIWLFYKFSSELSEEHAAIKLLFLFLNFFLIIVGGNLMIQIAKFNGADTSLIDNLQTFYNVLIWVTTFVVGYFIIYYVYKVLISLNVLKRSKNEN